MASPLHLRASLLQESSLISGSGHVDFKVEGEGASAVGEGSTSGSTSGSTLTAGGGSTLQGVPVDSDGWQLTPAGWSGGILGADASVPLLYLPRTALLMPLAMGGEPNARQGAPLQASVLDGGAGDTNYSGASSSSSSAAQASWWLQGSNSLDTPGQPSTSDQLLTVLSNYLALGQLQLARTVMEQMFAAAPEKLIRALRAIVFTNIPAAWLFSRAVPSAGHLSWLAYVEYKQLYARVYPSAAAGLSDPRDEDLSRQALSDIDSIAGGVEGISATPARLGSGGKASGPSAAAAGAGAPIPISSLPAISNTLINPFGFVTHDRLTISIVESEGCRVPARTGAFFARLTLDQQQLNSRVVVSGAQIGASSGPSRSQMLTAGNVQFKHTFQTTVWYTDSSLWIKVYACAPVQNTAAAVAGAPVTAVRNQICVGEVSLPLGQIRAKNKYHVWLPLHAPANMDPSLLSAAGGGAGGSSSSSSATAPSASSFGRVRVKLVWWKSGLVPAGDFSLRTRWLLETDLLMANAVVNHRLSPSKKLLTPDIVDEMRAYARACWSQQVQRQRLEMQQAQERFQLQQQALLSAHTATAGVVAGIASMFGRPDITLAQTAAVTVTADGSTEGILGAAGSAGFVAPPTPLSDDVFRHLRRLIRSVPVVGHALAAQLCLISPPATDQLLFQHLYVQLVGEMAARREFGRACETLVHVCKDIFADVVIDQHAPPPNLTASGIDGLTEPPHAGSAAAAAAAARAGSSASPSLLMLDEIFLLFVVFIHGGFTPQLEKMAGRLMHGQVAGLEEQQQATAGGETGSNTAGGEGSSAQDASKQSSRRSSGSVQQGGQGTGPASRATDIPSLSLVVATSQDALADMRADNGMGSLSGKDLSMPSEADAVDTFNLILDRKTKIYSALMAACGQTMKKIDGEAATSLTAVWTPAGNTTVGAMSSSSNAAHLLKRFCVVEDAYLRALVDSMGRFPSFFQELLGNPLLPSEDGGLYATPQMPAEMQRKMLAAGGDDAGRGSAPAPESDNLSLDSASRAAMLLDEFVMFDFSDDPTFLHGFWRYYSEFLRIHSEHMFDFVVQVCLTAIRLNQWNKVALVLKPFNKLRPLVLLLAWDAYENDYAKRRELVIRIWRSQRMHAAREMRERRKQHVVNADGSKPPALPSEGADTFRMDPDMDDATAKALAAGKSPPKPAGDKQPRQRNLDEEDPYRDSDDSDYSSEEEDEDDQEIHDPAADEAEEINALCSEPKLIQWCDRLDVFVLWIDTLLNIHPVLRELPRPAQETQALLLLSNLRTHSILYSFHTFLPSLSDPEQLLQLIDPHESEELKHDYHIMRSFYALRVAMEIMAHSDSRSTEAPQGHSATARKVAGYSLQEGSFQSFFASRLEALKLHILSMTTPHFQVVTLEKIFSLLFIHAKAWGRYERNLERNLKHVLDMASNSSSNPNAEGAAPPNLPEEDEAEPEEEDAPEGDGDPAAHGWQGDGAGGEPSAYFHLKGAIISELLHFLKDTINQLMIHNQQQAAKKEEAAQGGAPKAEDPAAAAASSSSAAVVVAPAVSLYPASAVLSRLQFLRSKVVEGIWRLSITQQLMHVQQPRLSHLVSTLSSMAVFFLQRDQSLEAHLQPPFADLDYARSIAQPFLAQHAAAARIVSDTMKWAAMVAAVQELELEGKGKQACAFILDAIARFHVPDGAAPGTKAPEFNALKQHQHLQSYFLYMDSAITFAHLMSEADYTAMLQKAVQHTRVCLQRMEQAEAAAAERRRKAEQRLRKHPLSAGQPAPASVEADDVDEEESISMELLQFYTAYAETRCMTSSNALLQSNRAVTFHPYSLDDANQADAAAEGPAAVGRDGVSESMLDEYRPFGFDSSPHSTYSRWMSVHGAQLGLMSAADGTALNVNTSVQVATPYLTRYYSYLASIVPVNQSQRALLSPWAAGVNAADAPGIRVIEYLAEHTAFTRETNPAKMAHPPQASFVDASSNPSSASFNPFAYLALQVLPALAAVRYGMRAALHESSVVDVAGGAAASGPDAFEKLSELARQHSQFNPAFHRWVQWRLALYKQLHSFARHAKTIPFVFRPKKTTLTNAPGSDESSDAPLIHSVEQFLLWAHDSLSAESVIQDQNVIMLLCDLYVDTFESMDLLWVSQQKGAQQAADVGADEPYRKFLFQTKLEVLALADAHLDHPAHAHAVALIDRLLASIITDASAPHALRAELLLRVNDVLGCSVWSMQYLQHWTDVHTCTDVLLKCLAGLSTLEISDDRAKFGELGASSSSSSSAAAASSGDKSKKPDHLYDHRHRFDEFESSDEEEEEQEDGAADDAEDDQEQDEEEADAGVANRAARMDDGGVRVKKVRSGGAAAGASAKSPSNGSALTRAAGAVYTGSIAELRSSIEFKYHVILIYKQLLESDEAAPLIKASEPNVATGAVSAPLYSSWQSLESACNVNLTAVILILIQHKLVDIAQKLYVLYKTYSKLYPAPERSKSEHKDAAEEEIEAEIAERRLAQEMAIDAHLSNQLESASLASLLSAASPTSDRIFAIKRLQALPAHRTYEVGEAVLAYLDSSHSRYVIAQLLAHFLEQEHQRLRAMEPYVEQQALAAAEAEAAAAAAADAEADFDSSVFVSNPATAVPGEVGSVAGGSSYGGSSSSGVGGRLLGVSQLPTPDGSHWGGSMPQTPGGDARSVSGPSSSHLLRRRFYSSLSAEKERWFIQVHHATKMLVCLPDAVQHSCAHLYADPLGIVRELLHSGQPAHVAHVFPVFRDYCALTSSSSDAFFFLLNFASRLLTLGLEELGLDQEIGFMLLSLCCSYGQQSRVAKLSLIIVDILSAKLNMHAQPYLLMHIITAMLIFVGREVLPLLTPPLAHQLAEQKAQAELMAQYQQYVRMCCGREVDSQQPTYAAALPPVLSRKEKALLEAAAQRDGTAGSAAGVMGSTAGGAPEQKESAVPSRGGGGGGSSKSGDKSAGKSNHPDVESALAAELKHSESRLPLLYALLTVPLLPSLNSPLPLDKIPSPSALLLRFLSPTFSLQHLWRADKAAALRDQLLACNANSLAKRVWKECEHRSGADWESFIRARSRQVQRA